MTNLKSRGANYLNMFMTLIDLNKEINLPQWLRKKCPICSSEREYKCIDDKMICKNKNCEKYEVSR